MFIFSKIFSLNEYGTYNNNNNNKINNNHAYYGFIVVVWSSKQSLEICMWVMRHLQSSGIGQTISLLGDPNFKWICSYYSNWSKYGFQVTVCTECFVLNVWTSIQICLYLCYRLLSFRCCWMREWMGICIQSVSSGFHWDSPPLTHQRDTITHTHTHTHSCP